MLIRSHLQEILAVYTNKFGMTDSVQAFQLFMNAYEDLTSRRNLAGHVTGSALVWHKKTDRVLRVRHTKLNRWVFSAGGHIDDGELPWQAVTRELSEETGIVATPIFNKQNPLPLIMDAHPIPASVKKAEPAHWHYDIVYLFSVDQKPEIHADPKEISEFHWVDVNKVTKENSSVDLHEQMVRYGA